jgi:uncharacterized coiled-coil protein SlyX
MKTAMERRIEELEKRTSAEQQIRQAVGSN